MKERRLLVLVEDSRSGAGQRFARAGRNLGLQTVALVRDPAGLTWPTAEGVELIATDTSDLAAVIQACALLRARAEIAGITTASERFYAMAAAAARYFGLPGPDPAAVKACQDKIVQRERLTAARLRTPAYRVASSPAVARRCAQDLGLPVIVKPVTGSGSYGVKLCSRLGDVAEQADFILAGRHGLPALPITLVEAFVAGAHYCTSTIGMEVAGISAVGFSDPPYFALKNFEFPAALTSAQQDEMARVTKAALRALGLGWGPANTELRLTADGPVVIEVNPRIVGTPDPEMYLLAYGVDLFAETLKLFVGGTPDMRPRHRLATAACFVMIEQNGMLEAIEGEGAARAVPGVASVSLSTQAGAPLVRHGDFRDVIGHVIAVSPDPARAREAVRQAMGEIRLTVSQAASSPPRPASPAASRSKA